VVVAQLSVETTVARRATVIALHGELDLAGAIVLEQELARLDVDGREAIVIDLRGVEFMDSSGLRVIATNALAAQEHGRRFALVPGAAQIMRVFDITRMRERFDFVDDTDEVTGS
jgi:anti-sigma B factor antagonist